MIDVALLQTCQLANTWLQLSTSGIHMLIDARREQLYFVNGVRMGTSQGRMYAVSACVPSLEIGI